MYFCSERCPLEASCEGVCYYPNFRIKSPTPNSGEQDPCKQRLCQFCGIRSPLKIRVCCIAGNEEDKKLTIGINTPEPNPIKNNHPAVWDLVLKDMAERDAIGEQKYGTRLQPHNGRDALKDAYQEALDLIVYLRQAIYERDNQ